MSKIPLHWQQWVSKFVLGHFSHGKNMQCWHFRSSASCPHCSALLDDKLHIIRCPTPEATAKWQSFLTDLKLWLREQKTSPTLADAILSSLQAWYKDEPVSLASQATSQLLADQSAIGWDQLIEGWIHWSWQVEQEQFWSHIWTHKSSKRCQSWLRSSRTLPGTCGINEMKLYILIQPTTIFLTATPMTKSGQSMSKGVQRYLVIRWYWSRNPLLLNFKNPWPQNYFGCSRSR